MSPLALSIRFLQTQPDSKLLELARAGHERAFEALVQRYRRPLLNYCRRLSRSEASAEDALQQALLQAWIALGSGDPEIRDVRAWLYRIVHNVAISSLRRPVHDQVHEDQAVEGGSADQVVERRLALRDALAGLASLPELQRQVMLSTALEGQSHDEVATALGLSHGAVRGLIYRARATLRAAAAVVVPGPLISWAARQQIGAGGRSAALAEAIGAGGSAGVAGVLLKGGAIVATAGALAGAAGVALHPNSHRFRGHRPSVAQTAAGTAVAAVRSASSVPPGTTAVSAALGPAAVLRVAGSASPGAAGAQAWHGHAVPPSGQHRSPITVSSTGSGSTTSHSGSSSHGPGGSSTGSGSSSSGGDGSSGSHSSGSSSSGHGSGGHDGSSIATSGSGGTSGKDGSGSGSGGDSSATAASSSETVSSDSSSSDGGSSGRGDGASSGSSGSSGSGRGGSDSHGGGSDGAGATTTPSVPVPGGD